MLGCVCADNRRMERMMKEWISGMGMGMGVGAGVGKES